MMRFRKKLFGASPKVSIGGVATNALMVGLPAYGMIQAHKEGKVAEKQSKASVEEMDKMTQAMNAKTRELDRKFEKSFGLPALLGSGALMVGTTGAQMLQSNSQMKKQEKMNGKQIAAQNRQTRAVQKQNELLNKIAEKGGSDAGQKAAEVLLPPNQAAPEKKKEADESFFSQRSFASVNWNSAKLVGRDLFRAAKTAGVGSTMKSNAKTALGMAGAAYVVNKAIQHDMKKNNIDVDKSGNLVQRGQKSYSIKDKLKRAAGPGIGAAMTFSFEAPRYLSYQAEKKQLKGQIAATGSNNPNLNSGQTSIMAQQKPLVPRQKQFGRFQLNRQGWNTFNAHRGRSISGMGVQLTSFGLGTENVQKFGSSLAGSKSNLLKKTGTWIGKHPTKANVAALVPAAAIGALSFNKVMSAGKKGLEKVDPDAYKYQNAKDNAVGGQNS